MKRILPGILAVLLAGCAAFKNEPLTDLTASVTRIEDELSDHRELIDQLTNTNGVNDSINNQLSDLLTDLDALPDAVAAACRKSATPAANNCKAPPAAKPVLMKDDKMVVGELERVWLNPPGMTMVARIDTGATSSSLHADEIVAFERDGEDWVRFKLANNGDEPVTVERAVKRYVRVLQQADKQGSRRMVVEMRIRLGDVEDSFELTLANRSHLDQEMILGRNFLTDIAIVDVARQFVQPAKPQ